MGSKKQTPNAAPVLTPAQLAARLLEDVDACAAHPDPSIRSIAERLRTHVPALARPSPAALTVEAVRLLVRHLLALRVEEAELRVHQHQADHAGTGFDADEANSSKARSHACRRLHGTAVRLRCALGRSRHELQHLEDAEGGALHARDDTTPRSDLPNHFIP